MSDELQPPNLTLTSDLSKDLILASDEEQRTQSMMYAVRMTYLDSSEQRSPNPMFLTRKQAQKMTQQQQDSLILSFKHLEAMRMHATNGPTVANWKKSKAAMTAMETKQTWEPRFQAGCHFYECVETGECRVLAPDNLVLPGMTTVETAEDEDSDDEGPPFPDSFAFLNDSHK